MNNAEVGGRQPVEESQQQRADDCLPTIAHVTSATCDTMGRLINKGLIGVLLKPFDRAQGRTELEVMVKRLTGDSERRRHIHVPPDPDGMLRLHLRIDSHKGPISERIVNVSMGGVACELHNAPSEDLLSTGMQILALNFLLASREPRCEEPAQRHSLSHSMTPN